MRKVIAFEWMAFDGVVQAPGSPDEDRSGGFAHGGWHLRYFDDLTRDWVVQNFAAAGGFLFGRRTYESLAGYWPNATEEEQVIAQPLNEKPKYVASTTLSRPLSWANSNLLGENVAAAIAGLKQQDGGPLLIIGSSDLVHTLFEHDLIDELRVMVDPVLVGGGKRLFPDDGRLRELELIDQQVSTTGAIVASYGVICRPE